MTYFAQCTIDDTKRDKVAELRQKHLAYIKEFGFNIVYGGVCGDEDVPYQSICFFIDVESEVKARSFVEQDPYFCTYAKVEIQQFAQKIPRAAA